MDEILESQPMTVREVAQLLRVNEWQVRRAVRDGRLPAIRLNQRVIRIERSAVAAWVAAGRTGGSEA
jgi:excisionase family DNA binding protein